MNLEFYVIAIFRIVDLQTSPWKILWLFCSNCAPSFIFKKAFMGPCIINIFQFISNEMHLYAVYVHLETALHVSGGTSTHHQERIHLYLHHLVFVTLLLLPAAYRGGVGTAVPTPPQ
jgi:hypothetical protein